MSGEHDATLQRFEDSLADLDPGRLRAHAVRHRRIRQGRPRDPQRAHALRAAPSGHYQLEVVDIHRDTALMMAHDVLASPTLIKEAPLPRRRLVGDLSDTSRVLAALDIAETATGGGPGG
jgi:hypothetical protein